MASDLLGTIRSEIDERLSELRPLLAEYEQLLVAADALVASARSSSSVSKAEKATPAKRTRGAGTARAKGRGTAAGAIKLAGTPPADAVTKEDAEGEPAKSLDAAKAKGKAEKPKPSASKSKPARAPRGAAREAILAALDHGSHTIGELVVVTAMSAPNINGNLRRLLSDGAVVKTEREGKAAWALPGAAA